MKSTGIEQFNFQMGRASGLAGVCITLAMMVGIVADILMRNLFNQPIPGMVELEEYLMVAITFLALSLAEIRGEHVIVRLFVARFPKTPQWVAYLVSQLILMAVLAFLIVLTGREFIHSVQIGEYRWGMVKWPTSPARFSIAAGIAAYFLVVLLNTYSAIRSRLLTKSSE